MSYLGYIGNSNARKISVIYGEETSLYHKYKIYSWPD